MTQTTIKTCSINCFVIISSTTSTCILLYHYDKVSYVKQFVRKIDLKWHRNNLIQKFIRVIINSSLTQVVVGMEFCGVPKCRTWNNPPTPYKTHFDKEDQIFIKPYRIQYIIKESSYYIWLLSLILVSQQFQRIQREGW